MDLVPSMIGLLGGIGAGAAYTIGQKTGREWGKRPIYRVLLLDILMLIHLALADL